MSSESETKESAQSKKKSPSSTKTTATLKRVDSETAKLIQMIKDKANKKSFGRNVRDAEIIACGVKLIEPRHIKTLQEETLSQNDRLRMLHDEYQKANGKLTLDQFIGKLIRGEVGLTAPAEPQTL